MSDEPPSFGFGDLAAEFGVGPAANAPKRPFIQRHRGAIKSGLEALRAATLVLPAGLFGNAVNAELANAFATAAKSVHLWALGETTPSLRCGMDTDLTRTVKRALELITAFQVYLEMRAHGVDRKFEKARWKMIVRVSAAKWVLQMILLAHNRGAAMPPATEEDLRRDESFRKLDSNDPLYEVKRVYLEAGRDEHNPHGYFSALTRHYRPIVDTSERAVATTERLAEFLYWTRPLVYAILLYRAGRLRKKSWRPVLVALAMDLMAMTLLRKSVDPNSDEGRAKILEKEVSRRWLYMLYYLGRPPVLGGVTALALSPLRRLPGLGSAVDFVINSIDELPHFTVTPGPSTT